MNQVESSQNLKLTQSEVFLLQNHYKSCPTHPRGWLTSLSVDPKATQFLQCCFCLSENSPQNTLPLIGLIDSDERTVFRNWPIQGDQQLYEKLLKISQSENKVEGLIQQIQEFFLNLRKSVDQKINEKESSMIAIAKSLWNFNENIMNDYKKFAEIDALKEIIIEHKDDFTQQNQKLGEIVTRTHNNQKEYQQALMKSISHFETQKAMINFDVPNQISENILQLLDKIDMFVIKNFEDIRVDKFQENIELYQSHLNHLKPCQMTTSQLIVKLIRNKFNNCSQQLIDKLQNLIARISGFFDKADVSPFINEDILDCDLDILDAKQFNIIKELSSQFVEGITSAESSSHSKNKKTLLELISNKFNNCSDDFIDYLSIQFDTVLPFINELDFSNYLISQKTSISGSNLTAEQIAEIGQLVADIEKQNTSTSEYQCDALQSEGQELKQIELINKIIQNKFNYCSYEFIENIQVFLKKYQKILSHFLLNQKILQFDKEEPLSFDGLDPQQMYNVEILVSKIVELSQKYKTSYKNNQYPNKVQQSNSFSFFDQAKTLFQTDYFSKLLVDYPIFELNEDIRLKQVFVNQLFVNTKYEQSSDLTISRNNEGNVIISQPKSLNGQVATTNSINPYLNYVVRFKFNKSLNCNRIVIGVMQTENIDSQRVSAENCCFNTYYRDYGLNQVIKGSNLYDVRNEISYLELRINIQKRIVIFADYPNYNHINQMDPSNMKEDTPYSIAIRFCTPGDDWTVEITDMFYIDDDEKILKFE